MVLQRSLRKKKILENKIKELDAGIIKLKKNITDYKDVLEGKSSYRLMHIVSEKQCKRLLESAKDKLIIYKAKQRKLQEKLDELNFLLSKNPTGED